MTHHPLTAQKNIEAAVSAIQKYGSSGAQHLSCVIHKHYDLLNVLEQKGVHESIYWSNRDQSQVTAAWGMAHLIMSHDAKTCIEAAQNYTLLNDVRLYGCIGFDTELPDEHLFWLPEWELRLVDECLTLYWNRPSESIPLPSFSFQKSKVPQLPTKETWISNITELKPEFENGNLSKVVFAQQICLPRPNSLKPLGALRQLRSENDNTFHFCVSPKKDYAFIGCSPERLLCIRDGVLQTEALAGTRPRGENKIEDQSLEDELRVSEKENKEHQIVVDDICDSIGHYALNLMPNTHSEIIKFHHVQHLYTPITGTLYQPFSIADILLSLHPTPAVGGVPQRLAMSLIRKAETFRRGWYAGPVGWIEKNSAEFAVGIRSALLTQDYISFWAGAGILSQSDPEEEWNETQTKGKQFLDLVAK